MLTPPPHNNLAHVHMHARHAQRHTHKTSKLSRNNKLKNAVRVKNPSCCIQAAASDHRSTFAAQSQHDPLSYRPSFGYWGGGHSSCMNGTRHCSKCTPDQPVRAHSCTGQLQQKLHMDIAAPSRVAKSVCPSSVKRLSQKKHQARQTDI